MDWRLGRLITSVSHSMTGGAALALPSSKQRVALLFCINDNNASLGTDSLLATFGSNEGTICISEGQLPYLVSLTTHGNIPTKAWVFTQVANNEPYTVVEFFLPEEYLTEGVDTLRKEWKLWPRSP